jgi:Tol biopolymer transport system component
MRTDLKLSSPLCGLCSIAFAQQTKRALIEDILKLKTISEVQISPDGKWVATVSEMDMKKDKSLTRVYSIPMNGGEPIAITGKDYSGSQPRWSPDISIFLFSSKKEDDKAQV